MPEVVLRDAFDAAQSHRQRGLSAFKRLDPASFVDALHYRMATRVNIQFYSDAPDALARVLLASIPPPVIAPWLPGRERSGTRTARGRRFRR